MFDVDGSPFIFHITLQFIARFIQSYLVEEKSRKQKHEEGQNYEMPLHSLQETRFTAGHKHAYTMLAQTLNWRLLPGLFVLFPHTVPFIFSYV